MTNDKTLVAAADEQEQLFFSLIQGIVKVDYQGYLKLCRFDYSQVQKPPARVVTAVVQRQFNELGFASQQRVKKYLEARGAAGFRFQRYGDFKGFCQLVGCLYADEKKK